MHQLGEATDEALTDLASAVQALACSLGHPVLRAYRTYRFWRYDATDEWPIIVVKSARVVSGINAMRALIEAGFSQEAQVINRTINDFLLEIAALLEPHINTDSQAVRQRIIDEFYGEPIPHQDFLSEIVDGQARAGRKRVSAAAGRIAAPTEPSTMIDGLRAVSAVLDGYVHGAYFPSMELYDPVHNNFRLLAMTTMPTLALLVNKLPCTLSALCQLSAQRPIFADLMQWRIVCR